MTKQSTTEQLGPQTQEILALIRASKLQEAEQMLNALLDLPSVTNVEKLSAYNHLIRLAAESRSIEKIQPYIEKIKAVPLITDEDQLAFAKCLYAVGIAWGYAGAYEEARRSFERARALAEKFNDPTFLGKVRLALAEIMRSEGKYEEILGQLPDIRTICEASGESRMLGNFWTISGNVLRKLGSYREALDSFEKAKNIFNEHKASPDYHYVLWAMGTCYAALEEKEKALIYLDLARNNAKDLPFWRIRILSNLTQAELFTVTGQFDEVEALYKRTAEELGSDESSHFGRRLLRGQTLFHIKKGEFDKANEFIDRLVVMAVKEKNEKEIMRLRLMKAEVLLRTGDAVQQDEARDMLQEALAFFADRDIRRHQAVALELLARLDARAGYAADARKKIEDMLIIAKETSFERLLIRGLLAEMVLLRKMGEPVTATHIQQAEALINKINAEAERVVLSRFRTDTYEAWTQELLRLNPHARRFVNEFFEDFHFVPQQSTDLEIDRNSHYVREKHLGEIPFHNKFTLMRILLLLAETPGREFSKEQLAKEIWGQEYNPLRHDNNIYININRLRKLIEPNPRESRYIMNGPRGYYFNPEMKVNISSKISSVAPRAVGPAMMTEDLS